MSKVVVSGSMHFEESSSDEEEEVAVHSYSAPIDTSKFAAGDDSDGELEVFIKTEKEVKQVVVASSSPVVAKGNSSSGAAKNLIDMMEISVAAVVNKSEKTLEESGEVNENKAFEMDVASYNDVVRKEDEEKPAEAQADMFGITYKPYGKKKNSYALPSGEAVMDEEDKEFAAELEKVVVQSKETGSEEVEDEEFDLDIGDSTAAAPATTSEKEIERGDGKGKEEMEEEEMLQSLRLELEATEAEEEKERQAKIRQERDTAKEQHVKDQGEKEKGGVLAAAREAMATVAGIYEEGAAGDMQVQLDLDRMEQEEQEKEENAKGNAKDTEQSKQKPTKPAKPANPGTVSDKLPVPPSKGIMSSVMEEGDEDEEEDEDNNAEDGERNRGSNGNGKSGQTAVMPPPPPQNDKTPTNPKASMSEEELQWAAVEEDSANSGLAPPYSSASAEASAEQAFTSYADTLVYLKKADLAEFLSKIRTFEPLTPKRPIMSMLGLVSKSKVEALSMPGGDEMTKKELDWPFLCAHLEYKPEDPRHLSILQTIFHRLCPNFQDAPAKPSGDFAPPMGEHWDLIGFQGADPRTDINRAMKTLSLLQALHYVEDATLEEALSVHALSLLTPNHPQNRYKGGATDLSWPFMCVSISFTKEALVALRTGELNSWCNKAGNVLSVLHAYHRACFYHFKSYLVADPGTHHAYHLATLREQCKTKPAVVLQQYLQSGGSINAAFTKNKSKQSGKKKKPTGGASQYKDSEEVGTFVDFSSKGVNVPDPSDEFAAGSGVQGKASRFLA